MGDTDAGRWVELRVHGVSGTPPGSMLDRPHVVQVGGDDESRYFRSTDATGAELPGDDGQVLEAYHWGRLTSGSKVKALWLVLLPFGMVNAAQFMLLPVGNHRLAAFAQWLCRCLLRLLAILLTSLFAFSAGLVLIDLLAWRWAPQVRLLGNLDPNVVVGAATAFTGVVMFVLPILGRGYERGRMGRWWTLVRSPSTRTPRVGPTPAAAAPTPLADDAFYAGDSDAPILRDLHLAAGWLVVCAMGVWAPHPTAWRHDDVPLRLAIVSWVVVVVLATLLGEPESARSVRLPAPLVRARRAWHWLVGVVSPLLVVGSGALLVYVVATTSGISTTEWTQVFDRPESFDYIANWLLVIGVVVLVALLLANALLVATLWRERPPKGSSARAFMPYAGGMAASVVATIGTFVGVGFAAAVTTGISSLLNLSQSPSDEPMAGDLNVGTTPMLDRVAYAWGLNVVVFVLIALTLFVWRMWPKIRHAVDDRVQAMYGGAGHPLLAERWQKRVRKAVHVARLKNAIGPSCVAFVLFGMVLAGVLAWELWPCRNASEIDQCREAWGLFDLASQPKFVIAEGGLARSNVVALFGAWVLLGAAGVLLAASRKAVAQEGKRRGLNVAWDVLGFWPHAVHPFAPRPYSQRSIADLRARLRWHLARHPARDDERAIVLCGHSQGSLLSFATLTTLSQAERERIALLTFGSQLRVIFPRAFPEYVSFASIAWLYDRMNGAWINLYRVTDQLAGPVLSWRREIDTSGHEGRPPAMSWHFPAPYDGARPDTYAGEHQTRRCGADWRLADPVAYDSAMQDGAVSEILGHSWYARNPDWIEALRTVRAVPVERRTTPDRGKSEAVQG
ncbi:MULTISPECIES: hypothetical protein [Mumia]|uniref:hypothetical protein n=1 Tax=Mumia TaxID=1546255 RepID=UPI001424A2C2|nr:MULTISPECIES: hypothetical protein [unclassified Mumia]QMW67670.1 hypothetical protein H4N58_07290 [Mumia sp. ZJ1417]